MMAKKVKRKVSQVAATGSASAAGTQAVEVQATTETPATRAGYRSRSVSTTTEFNPDYTYVIKDLKRIGTLAGSFFLLLIILAFIIR